MSETTNETSLQVTVEDAVAGGRCLARHEGKILLVAGALPGETVRVRITRDQKRWAEADAVEILEPNPRRREPPCPHATGCGGCDLQHAERDLQLAMKRSIVLDAFRRIGRLDVEGLLEGPEANGPEFGGRNRIRLSFDSMGRPGLRRRGTHEAVPIDDCLLVQSEFREEILPWIRMLPPWKRAAIRFDSAGDCVALFESGDPPVDKDRRRFGKITSAADRPERVVGMLADRIPLAGRRDLRFRVRERELRADATSFFQGERAGTDELLHVVEQCLGEERSGQLLDLYAGVGLFAVCFGREFDRVVAADADTRAARYLKRNLRRNSVRAEARAEPADVTLRTAPAAENETVILDPPRLGLAKEVRQALVARRPGRIVSVSCDPATGARDVAMLVQAGWELKRLVAIDMFPVTAHVETVALLERDGAREGE
jgi:tRNA/tmRNA/rRNA uracil-C5-methylase (TrmA/RlmC/RlmD family)